MRLNLFQQQTFNIANKIVTMSNRIYLTNAKKERLIEFLLIVGSIVATLNLPARMHWVFMLFITGSVLYYVLLQVPKISLHSMILISVIISFSFTYILMHNYFVSLANANLNKEFTMMDWLTIIYFLIFSILLAKVLYRRK